MKNLWHQDNRSSVIWRSYWRFTWIIRVLSWDDHLKPFQRPRQVLIWIEWNLLILKLQIQLLDVDIVIWSRCQIWQFQQQPYLRRQEITQHTIFIQFNYVFFLNCKTSCCCLKIRIFWIISCSSFAGSSKTIGIEPTYI